MTSQPLRPEGFSRDGSGEARGYGGADDAPEAILWAALSLAPEAGTTVAELMAATGMGRTWIYERLRRLAGRSQVIQVSHGRWRAAGGDDS